MKRICLLSLVSLFSLFSLYVHAQPCTNVPGANTVAASSATICPGSSLSMGLANSYSTTGITYQWLSSAISSVGPFVAITGATLNTYNTPTLATGIYFYSAIITCANGNASTTATSAQLTVVPTVTSTVPYFEGLEGINATNELPNCSWSATNLGSNCLTYTSGVSFSGAKVAAFFHSPGGTNYFYSNGIQLQAGIVYSTSVYYKVNNPGSSNWSDLSILLGTSQSSTGLVSLASTNAAATSTNWGGISNTFTVATTGLYYFAIRGTASTGVSEYLYWDNFQVVIPCTGPGLVNAPTLSVQTSSGTNSICAGIGTSSTLAAFGANTYTWSTGVNTSTAHIGNILTSLPGISVSGTNTLTGCTSSAYLGTLVAIYPIPNLSISPGAGVICPGQNATLTAFGPSNTFTWSTGGQTSSISVSPAASSIYSVAGTSTNGCVGSTSVLVTVSVPNVSATSSSSLVCAGDPVVLTGSGAQSYQWSGFSPGVQISVSPSVSTVYTLTGIDSYSCGNTRTVMITVKPLPTISVAANSTLVCAGDIVTLTGSGAISYVWTGASITSAANVATVVPNASASYTVTGTGSNGCSADAGITVLVDQCTGIIEVQQFTQPVKVYPNPVIGELEIHFGQEGLKNIIIYDATGRRLLAESTVKASIRLDLRAFPAGIYSGTVQRDDQRQNFRIVKE